MKLAYLQRPSGLNSRLFEYAFRRIAKSFRSYQPISLHGHPLQPGQRNCLDRWTVIAASMQTHAVSSLLDLGCAEGYFVRRAAQEFGCFALGVDADSSRILVAQTCVLLDRVAGAAFTLADIDAGLLQKLPNFDAVLFLSVMHHVMYEHGIDHARRLLVAIRARTQKFLIFDMGQSNETRNEWARLLPDMGSDPASWIADFLRSAGFTDVEKLCETDSYQNEAARTVFLARP
jgi:cyclopropane fatty-acyl-phospholipid synthase-like methyltransferase